MSFVADLAAKAGFGADKGIRLQLAIEEWIVNVCSHAYGGRGGTIEVALRQRSGSLLVDVADDGPPFDPTAASEPDVAMPLEEREPGGLGLLLIRRMTDEISYSRDGGRNVVTFTISTGQS